MSLLPGSTIPSVPGVLSHQAIVKQGFSTIATKDFWLDADSGNPTSNIICNTITVAQNANIAGDIINTNGTIYTQDISGVQTINGVVYPPPPFGNSLNTPIDTNDWINQTQPCNGGGQDTPCALYFMPIVPTPNKTYLVLFPYNFSITPGASPLTFSITVGFGASQQVISQNFSYTPGGTSAWAGTLSGIYLMPASNTNNATLSIVNDSANALTAEGQGDNAISAYFVELT